MGFLLACGGNSVKPLVDPIDLSEFNDCLMEFRLENLSLFRLLDFTKQNIQVIVINSSKHTITIIAFITSMSPAHDKGLICILGSLER